MLTEDPPRTRDMQKGMKENLHPSSTNALEDYKRVQQHDTHVLAQMMTA